MTLNERLHIFIKEVMTSDTRIQLESGGTDSVNTALDLIELSWQEALKANQALNGDL